jgi:predicted ATP-binding protein involved in virulence
MLRIVLGQFLQLPKEEGQESVVRNKLKNAAVILEHLKEPLKYFSVIEDVRIAPSYSIYYDATLRSYIIKNLFVEYKVNHQWLPFGSLSNGTKRVFYVTAEVMAMDAYRSFVKLLTRGHPSATRVYANQILLLEEPELGLHPHQLADLMNFLKEQAKHKQIIISTHSPIVFDSVNPYELDRVHITELTPEGTRLRRLTPEQQKKAQIFADTTGLLSDYWRFSDLEA